MKSMIIDQHDQYQLIYNKGQMNVNKLWNWNCYLIKKVEKVLNQGVAMLRIRSYDRNRRF